MSTVAGSGLDAVLVLVGFIFALLTSFVYLLSTSSRLAVPGRVMYAFASAYFLGTALLLVTFRTTNFLLQDFTASLLIVAVGLSGAFIILHLRHRQVLKLVEVNTPPIYFFSGCRGPGGGLCAFRYLAIRAHNSGRRICA